MRFNLVKPSLRARAAAPRFPAAFALRSGLQGPLFERKLRVVCSAVNSNEKEILIVEDKLTELLEVLPEDLREPLLNHPRRGDLLEIVMDLGRRPEARFLGSSASEPLRAAEVTPEDLQAAQLAVGDFGADNRAGIEGTLHRISAIRNRRGQVVGLTCRVGRAVSGHVEMVRDLLDTNSSLLFLGRPGVGKTTVIREIARVLSEEFHKRVVIVDTSNEIGGDGDVPHPAIGAARRMQVPDPTDQHRIMIEAVENHMPEVIIVDEIGNEAEALACRTIAERGVMLIGTAHGQLLENLIKNPSLSDLIGGISSVTLSDEEARLRGTQKSVLERKAPPTFPLVVEMRERHAWVAHWVEDSVDALLNGKVPMVQLRQRNPDTREVRTSQATYDACNDLLGGPGAAAGGATGASVLGLGSGAASGAPAGRPGSPIGRSAAAAAAAAAADAELYDSAWGLGGPSDGSDPYAWAQRLRAVPDKDALQEMAALGYLGGDPQAKAYAGSVRGRSARLQLTAGPGSSARRNKRRGGEAGSKRL